ncbi:hypothetical protein CcaverHIS641_0201990 [Cutaneotrichosporon cavernicola]|nr:hypothetical protein CcaverHIS641_0201990 [Cutaneotrichosporon cavernicola]
MRLKPIFALMSLALAIPRVLVYTRTLGYRHDSIPTAIATLSSNGPTHSIEDPTQFADENLSRFDGIMFVSTSEEVLNGPQQDAMARYLRSGGVYVGVHSASACLYNDTVYLQAVGAYFDYHPSLQPASATILLTVEEGSYINDAASTGNYTFGSPHPIAWFIENPQYGGKVGRSFYTSLGHTNETWNDGIFIAHVFGGLKWALDGATTRAYGAGVVGNNDTVANVSGSVSGTSAAASTSASPVSPSGPASQPSSGAQGLSVASAAIAAAAGLLTIL